MSSIAQAIQEVRHQDYLVHPRSQSRHLSRRNGSSERCRARDVRNASHSMLQWKVGADNRGLHGYSHENPTAMNAEQQRDILEHTFKQLTEFCGKPPVGSVAPWWEVSKEGTEMLLDKGIIYGEYPSMPRQKSLTPDHSFHHRDSQCYWLRMGDSWKKIDYNQSAKTWMEPLIRGEVTGMVEIPANWDVSYRSPFL